MDTVGAIKLTGMSGSSTNKGHEKWSDVKSCSFQVYNTRTGEALNSPGKTTFNDISVRKALDLASPDLFKACCEGKRLSQVEIHLFSSGGSQQHTIISLKLTNAVIRSVIPNAHENEEDISLGFEKIEYSCAPLGPNGRPAGPFVKTWNTSTNAEK